MRGGASAIVSSMASSRLVESAATKSPASATVRASTPRVSSVSEIIFAPTRLMVPYVGLYPTTPQNAAGRIIEPAVCEPKARGTIQSATAAPDPDDDPPGVCSGLRGLHVGPGWKVANSVVTVLPRTTAPAARARATLEASAIGR